jgi:hypothetical protein
MPRGRNGVGAAFGAGAVIGIVVLLARASREEVTPSGSPRERSPVLPPSGVTKSPLQRFSALVERWRDGVARRAKDLPHNGILAWISIESGGDMCSIGNPNEAGIFQLAFPADAKFGATLQGLRAICKKSQSRNPTDISWLSEDELDIEVGAGIRKILSARDDVRRIFAMNNVNWPESSADFGSAVKQIHAAPAVISELVPKIARQSGPPANWSDLHRSVMAFPVNQMGNGLRSLWNAPSRHGLQNRLEDTLRNAEIVGHAWGISTARPAELVGRAWGSARRYPWSTFTG